METRGTSSTRETREVSGGLARGRTIAGGPASVGHLPLLSQCPPPPPQFLPVSFGSRGLWLLPTVHNYDSEARTGQGCPPGVGSRSGPVLLWRLEQSWETPPPASRAPVFSGELCSKGGGQRWSPGPPYSLCALEKWRGGGAFCWSAEGSR